MSVGPHVRGSLWGRNCSRCYWTGAYYTLAPNFGAVLHGVSLRRFHDFLVNPEWVFNMIEGGKIPYTDARSKLISCGKGMCRRLADLDCWHRNKTEMLVNERVQSVQTALRLSMKPFARWPVVDAWLSEVRQPLQSRKRCLVLYGPSRLGKTEVVRALFAVGSVLELNCAGLASICLHGFDN